MLSHCNWFGYVVIAFEQSMCNGYNAYNVCVVFSLRDILVCRWEMSYLHQFASTDVYVILLNEVFCRKNKKQLT